MAGVIEALARFGLSRDEQIFFGVLALNTILTLLYLLLSLLRPKERRGSSLLRGFVMLLCPVVAPCFFLLSWAFYRLFLHRPVDLADVIFSKEHVKTYLKADESRESNFVPLEEAITVTDTNSTRELMMEVVRRDVSSSLATIALALNSEDSEVSHYAASVLQETMDKLRTDYQRRYRQIMDAEAELTALENDGLLIRTDMDESAPAPERRAALTRLRDVVLRRGGSAAQTAFSSAVYREADDAQSEDVELYHEDNVRQRTAREAQVQALRAYDAAGEDEETGVLGKVRREVGEARKLMSDLCKVLRQKVFSTLEQNNYSEMLETLAELVDRRDMLSSYELEEVALHELSMGKYDACAHWCAREAQLYPDALGAYTSRLKLAFAQEDRDTFFRLLEELKRTDITLDHETLELVRTFSRNAPEE